MDGDTLEELSTGLHEISLLDSLFGKDPYGRYDLCRQASKFHDSVLVCLLDP